MVGIVLVVVDLVVAVLVVVVLVVVNLVVVVLAAIILVVIVLVFVVFVVFILVVVVFIVIVFVDIVFIVFSSLSWLLLSLAYLYLYLENLYHPTVAAGCTRCQYVENDGGMAERSLAGTPSQLQWEANKQGADERASSSTQGGGIAKAAAFTLEDKSTPLVPGIAQCTQLAGILPYLSLMFHQTPRFGERTASYKPISNKHMF